jgi:hypothetical protein
MFQTWAFLFPPSPDLAALNPPLPAGEREVKAKPERGEGGRRNSFTQSHEDGYSLSNLK